MGTAEALRSSARKRREDGRPAAGDTGQREAGFRQRVLRMPSTRGSPAGEGRRIRAGELGTASLVRVARGEWQPAGHRALGARRPGRTSSATPSHPRPIPRHLTAAGSSRPRGPSVQRQLSRGTSGSSSGGPWPSCPQPSLLAVPRAPAADFLASLALTAAKKVPCGPATCHPSAAGEAWRRLHPVADSSQLTPPTRPAPSWLACSPLSSGLHEHHPKATRARTPAPPQCAEGEVEAGGLCVSPVPLYYSHPSSSARAPQG